MTADRGARTVGLVTAPAVIDEWLEPLGVDLEGFAKTLTGGWMFNYVDALATRGIHTVIVCFSDWVEAPERLTHAPTGATIWMLPPGRGIARVRRWLAEPGLAGARDPRSLARGVRRHIAPYGLTPLRPLVHVLRRESCDAILSQDYHSQRFDVCLLAGKRLGVPVFATFQGGFFPPSIFSDLVRPLALKSSAGLIIPAGDEADRVRTTYGVPDAKCARIANPLDVADWRPLPRAESRAALGIVQDARVAVTHGRIDIHGKGLDVLLGAWAQARTEADGLLLLVGRGGDSAEVARMIASGRYPGARLVDEFVTDPEQLRRYLSAADVFVFAGRYEGFPVAVTEAMACGLPVVATAARGIPDLFEAGEQSGGVVVPRDDVQTLAAAIARLLADAELSEELGRRARRRVEQCCSLESVGRRLDEFMTRGGMRGG